MTSLKKIEQAVAQLPPLDLEKFADWFTEFQETAFDKAIETMAGNGALAEMGLFEKI